MAHTHTHTQTHTYTHVRTSAHKHTHTHTQHSQWQCYKCHSHHSGKHLIHGYSLQKRAHKPKAVKGNDLRVECHDLQKAAGDRLRQAHTSHSRAATLHRNVHARAHTSCGQDKVGIGQSMIDLSPPAPNTTRTTLAAAQEQVTKHVN